MQSAIMEYVKKFRNEAEGRKIVEEYKRETEKTIDVGKKLILNGKMNKWELEDTLLKMKIATDEKMKQLGFDFQVSIKELFILAC